MVYYYSNMTYNGENKMRQNITLRLTKRSEPIFKKVERIVNSRPTRQFAPTLLDIIELGIKSYYSGNRILDNEIVKPSVYKTGERTVHSIFNEVAETLYSSLAGSIADLGRYENSKKYPSQEKLAYYSLIRQALWQEKRFLNKFTDQEIKHNTDILSPILKAFNGDKEHEEKIIEANRSYFDNLIEKTGVAYVIQI